MADQKISVLKAESTMPRDSTVVTNGDNVTPEIWQAKIDKYDDHELRQGA
jgi:hypothetical protein